jgi:quercetin dioxygenase-like cupin family protein
MNATSTKAKAKAKASKRLDAYRTVVNFRTAKFKPYHLQGEVQSDLSWVNLSYDEKTGVGFFLVKFEPGAASIPHEHLDFEEFVILEGDITDSDGTVYKAGDCVSLKPGSRHVSVSSNGAISAVFVRGGFRTLSPGEKVSP